MFIVEKVIKIGEKDLHPAQTRGNEREKVFKDEKLL